MLGPEPDHKMALEPSPEPSPEPVENPTPESGSGDGWYKPFIDGLIPDAVRSTSTTTMTRTITALSVKPSSGDAAGLLAHARRPSRRKSTWLWKQSHALMPDGDDTRPVAATELEARAGR